MKTIVMHVLVILIVGLMIGVPVGAIIWAIALIAGIHLNVLKVIAIATLFFMAVDLVRDWVNMKERNRK